MKMQSQEKAVLFLRRNFQECGYSRGNNHGASEQKTATFSQLNGRGNTLRKFWVQILVLQALSCTWQTSSLRFKCLILYGGNPSSNQNCIDKSIEHTQSTCKASAHQKCHSINLGTNNIHDSKILSLALTSSSSLIPTCLLSLRV